MHVLNALRHVDAIFHLRQVRYGVGHNVVGRRVFCRFYVRVVQAFQLVYRWTQGSHCSATFGANFIDATELPPWKDLY